MGGIKFLMRKGIAADREALEKLLAESDMEVSRPPSEFLVVEIDGELAGAARLEWEEQNAYIRPIVVGGKWRGKDIGKVLVKASTADLPSLHVVARGGAVGFYRKLGFRTLPWEKVPERYQLECENCPALDGCRPEPMILTRSTWSKLLTSVDEECLSSN